MLGWEIRLLVAFLVLAVCMAIANTAGTIR